MEIKRKILLITCILISSAGLAFIYFSALAISPSETKISKIDSSSIGKLVSTTGKIYYVRTHSSGHIFLTLSDGDSRIEVPIFSSLVNKLNSNGITRYDLRKGRTVRITGIVGEYKGQLQIIPRKPTDIQILDSLK
ncbi:MAG: OB-fold nucleic acid binding domain-containing protein [Candidatus Aenigmatarchaeota archaeon]